MKSLSVWGVAMAVTQPEWPSRVPRQYIESDPDMIVKENKEQCVIVL